MDVTKPLYEVPTIRCNGDVVEHTHACYFRNIEADACSLSPPGSVGFGV